MSINNKHHYFSIPISEYDNPINNEIIEQYYGQVMTIPPKESEVEPEVIEAPTWKEWLAFGDSTGANGNQKRIEKLDGDEFRVIAVSLSPIKGQIEAFMSKGEGLTAPHFTLMTADESVNGISDSGVHNFTWDRLEDNI